MAQSILSSIFLSPNPTLRLLPKLTTFSKPYPSPISAVHVAPPPPSTKPPPQPLTSERLSPTVNPSREQNKMLSKTNAKKRCNTKFVCTVGPATCTEGEMEALARGGMSVARINMCHGNKEWHREVIESVRRLNEEKGYCVSVMMDTEGSEIHMGDLGGATPSAKEGDVWTFSVRSFHTTLPLHTIDVNYDGFSEDVRVGDEVLVDGGMVRFEVIEKIGPDVISRCIDPGLLLPRANLTIRRNGRLVQKHNAMLPTISSKDWVDIDFGILEGVDFIAVSFVKSAEVIYQLKSYIASRSRGSDISVIAKIENIDSLKNLKEIIKASDGVMVARLDLGAQIPMEQVPLAQENIVKMCRDLNKPVIVASQLLESMIEYPIPTRAEVADVSEAVRQKADALMLSGETAIGKFPIKALSVLSDVSSRMEKWLREENNFEDLDDISSSLPNSISKELCNSAADMADNLGADAIFVYTKSGQMASLLCHYRPNCPIFAFTPSTSVQRRLNLQWGLLPFQFNYSDDMNSNLNKSFNLLRAKGMVKSGDVIISVSDISQTIQVINFP